MIPSQFDNAAAAKYRCTSFNDDIFGSRCDVPQRAPASSSTSSRRRVGPRRSSIAVHDVIAQSATWSGETIFRDAVAEPPPRSSSSFAPPSSSSRRARLSSPSAHSTSTSIRRRVSKRRSRRRRRRRRNVGGQPHQGQAHPFHQRDVIVAVIVVVALPPFRLAFGLVSLRVLSPPARSSWSSPLGVGHESPRATRPSQA